MKTNQSSSQGGILRCLTPKLQAVELQVPVPVWWLKYLLGFAISTGIIWAIVLGNILSGPLHICIDDC